MLYEIPGVDPGFPFWWIFPISFGSLWLLTIALLIWKFSWWGTWGRHAYGPDALAVLRERLARGEIETEEFEQRKRALESK